MQIITLNELKANARIEENAEDTLLAAIGDAAEAMVLNLIEREYDDVISEFKTIPAPIKHACLMVGTTLYENRGALSGNQLHTIPYTVDALLKPYIRF